MLVGVNLYPRTGRDNTADEFVHGVRRIPAPPSRLRIVGAKKRGARHANRDSLKIFAQKRRLTPRTGRECEPR